MCLGFGVFRVSGVSGFGFRLFRVSGLGMELGSFIGCIRASYQSTEFWDGCFTPTGSIL